MVKNIKHKFSINIHNCKCIFLALTSLLVVIFVLIMDWIKSKKQSKMLLVWSNKSHAFLIELFLLIFLLKNGRWKVKKGVVTTPFLSWHPVLTVCRWAWRWITRRRCCWWVKPRTLAPARPRRGTETPALRLSTWWVQQPNRQTFLFSPFCWVSPPVCSVFVQYECQYCQYHVKAQYKKMSSKRAELQSSFSGKAPNKVKGSGLKERLCQDGFHYGGVSSAACAASLWVILKEAISLNFILLVHRL